MYVYMLFFFLGKLFFLQFCCATYLTAKGNLGFFFNVFERSLLCLQGCFYLIRNKVKIQGYFLINCMYFNILKV